MATQGVGTFAINSFWESGSLIFYEKAVGHTATGDVFTLGTAAVKVGGTSQDVDFQVYGTGSVSAIIDIGDATFRLEGIRFGIGVTTALTTVTTGLNAVKVQSNFTGLTTTSHLANFFVSQYTAAGTGSLRTVVGQVDLSGTQTTATTAQYLVGVHGRAKVSGTAYNTNLFVTGVIGQILDGAGTWTAASHISSIWGDWQSNDDISAVSSSELAYLSNNANSTTGNPKHVFYIYAPRLTNFIAFEGLTTTAGSMVTASATAGTMTYTVKCLIGDTACYLHLFNA